MNYGKPAPQSEVPNHRRPTWVSDAKNERPKIVRLPVPVNLILKNGFQEYETALLEQFSKNYQVKSIGYLPFTSFSVQDLLAEIKTITNDYAEKRGIKPPYNQEP